MGTKILLEDFEEIYNRTYNSILKYIILHCNNLDDVNDIIQETYIQLYKKLKKCKNFDLEDEKKFIIGITKNILKKYYRSKYKDNMIDIESEEIELESNIDIELEFITKENVAEIWETLKNKDIKIAKIFYLYYGLAMKIVDIAKELNITESATKNYIYRTIKELKNKHKEGV